MDLSVHAHAHARLHIAHRVLLALPQRYWGDLNPYISPSAIALQDLERRGVLQFWLDLHHAALHLVVLPYVNLVCERAMAAWNSHYVATAGMKCSPNRKCEHSA